MLFFLRFFLTVRETKPECNVKKLLYGKCALELIFYPEGLPYKSDGGYRQKSLKAPESRGCVLNSFSHLRGGDSKTNLVPVLFFLRLNTL